MDCLLEAGAYGSHSLTVLSNVGAKVLPLFNKIENLRFHGRSVYTNLPVSGAYRGYGATQGYFACESADRRGGPPGRSGHGGVLQALAHPSRGDLRRCSRPWGRARRE